MLTIFKAKNKIVIICLIAAGIILTLLAIIDFGIKSTYEYADEEFKASAQYFKNDRNIELYGRGNGFIDSIRNCGIGRDCPVLSGKWLIKINSDSEQKLVNEILTFDDYTIRQDAFCSNVNNTKVCSGEAEKNGHVKSVSLSRSSDTYTRNNEISPQVQYAVSMGLDY